MSPKAQRIAIAEACGYMQPHFTPNGCCVAAAYQKNDGSFWGSRGVPDYLYDLNAMHEAEIQLKAEDNHAYGCYCSELYEKYGNTISLTASQRCEAFLKTIDRWKK